MEVGLQREESADELQESIKEKRQMKETLIKVPKPDSERKSDRDDDSEWQTEEEKFTEPKTPDERTIATVKYVSGWFDNAHVQCD